MTDDQHKSYDHAESAATPESDGLPEIDRAWDLPGEALASVHDADEVAPHYVVDDPEAEELTTPESAPEGAGIDDPAQLDEATGVARSARSSRPVRRSTPLAPSEDVPGDAPATPRPSRRPVRRRDAAADTGATMDVDPDSNSTADDVAEDAEPALARSGGATAVGSSSLRPRRREVEVAEEAPATTRRGSRRKGRPTPQQRDNAALSTRRVGPAEFVNQSVGELRKVIWPTGEQLAQYFGVVLAFVLFIITFVGLLDLFFGWGLLKLLGN